MDVKGFYCAVNGSYESALAIMMNDALIERMLAKFMANNCSQAIIDATHLNTKSRMKLLKQIINKESVHIIPVWFNTPLEVCLKRNAKREGRECVPEDTLINMYNARQHPSEDNFPYTAILEVN